MEKKSLKETLELIAAIKLLGVSGISIAEGGLGVDDIAKAVQLLKDVNVLIEGIKGVGGAVEEVKDLDQIELLQLGQALFSAYKEIKAALDKLGKA